MDKFADKLLTIRNFVRKYKYLSVTLAFIVFITFIDENNLIRRINHNRKIGSLRKEIAKYKDEYEDNTRRLNELITNPNALEKIAREKYLMKKPDEDIYVFENNQ